MKQVQDELGRRPGRALERARELVAPPGAGTRVFRTLALLAAMAASIHAQAQAPAQAQGIAWVSSEKDNVLTLIDLGTLNVMATVPTCERGRHIQRLPDGLLMVACTDSNLADVIDPATRQSVRRIPLGEEPEAFDLSPDGKTVYVSNEDEGAVSFVDAASGKLLRSVKVGKEPEGVKASPDGRVLYVTSEVASLVHVIDVSSGRVIKNIPVGKRPRRMALTPDGRELWVSNELDASVSIISTATNAVVGGLRFSIKGARAEDITPVGILMSRDGQRAFVALGRANHVAFVDVLARKVTAMVLVGKRAWNLALDKSEKRLFSVNGLSDDVTVIDLASAKAIKSIPVGRVPYGLVVVE